MGTVTKRFRGDQPGNPLSTRVASKVPSEDGRGLWYLHKQRGKPWHGLLLRILDESKTKFVHVDGCRCEKCAQKYSDWESPEDEYTEDEVQPTDEVWELFESLGLKHNYFTKAIAKHVTVEQINAEIDLMETEGKSMPTHAVLLLVRLGKQIRKET